MSVNKIILVGNVGQNVNVRQTQSGNKIASFSLATSKSWKDKQTGERKTDTQWHKIVVYNEPLANFIENYVKTGSTLYIEGELKYGEYNNKEGQKVNTTEIVLQDYKCRLEILDKKDNNTAEEEKPAKKSGFKKQQVEDDEDLDKVPF
jgi:single-strand DNA-binding protein